MNYWCRRESRQGFTLIELMVVVAIIGILSSVALISFNLVRANARDKERISDLNNIQLAIKAYADFEGHYPREDDPVLGNDYYSGASPNGMICSDPTECTGPINALLKEYLGEIPQDPLHDGSTYYYYYDGKNTCGGYADQAVIFAKTTEMDGTPNLSDLKCTSHGTEGGSANTKAYKILLGDTSG